MGQQKHPLFIHAVCLFGLATMLAACASDLASWSGTNLQAPGQLEAPCISHTAKLPTARGHSHPRHGAARCIEESLAAAMVLPRQLQCARVESCESADGPVRAARRLGLQVHAPVEQQCELGVVCHLGVTEVAVDERSRERVPAGRYIAV